MKVWVVFEEDRGCGTAILGVFDSLKKAQEACYNSHCYYSEEVVK